MKKKARNQTTDMYNQPIYKLVHKMTGVIKRITNYYKLFPHLKYKLQLATP